MANLFFSGWDSLYRTFVVGVLAYIVLVIVVRVSGKRTLSKMNAFDFVVTVALGSTLATVLLNKQVALAEGTLALVLLVGLQFVITWSSVRVKWIRKVVTGEPQMLLYRGEFLGDSLRRARVTEAEIRAAARDSGVFDLQDVEADVLETDGSFSIVRCSDGAERSSLEDVTSPVEDVGRLSRSST